MPVGRYRKRGSEPAIMSPVSVFLPVACVNRSAELARQRQMCGTVMQAKDGRGVSFQRPFDS